MFSGYEKESIPDYLYKYKSIDSLDRELNGKFLDNGLDALSKGKIWFSHPKNLNDPYEQSSVFADNSGFFKDLKKYLNALGGSNLPSTYRDFISERKGMPEEQIIKELEEQIEWVYRTNPSPSNRSLKRRLEDYLEELKDLEENYEGILSLADSGENLLLWAYYAKDHYGYCLEFSSKEEHQGEPVLGDKKMCQKVHYDNDLLALDEINPFYTSLNPDAVQDRLDMERVQQYLHYHKSADWQHEREWRVVCDIKKHKESPTKPGALMPFPGKLTTVYLGARMSQNAVDAIKAAVAMGNYGYTVQFKKMNLDKTKFGLLPVDA